MIRRAPARSRPRGSSCVAARSPPPRWPSPPGRPSSRASCAPSCGLRGPAPRTGFTPCDRAAGGGALAAPGRGDAGAACPPAASSRRRSPKAARSASSSTPRVARRSRATGTPSLPCVLSRCTLHTRSTSTCCRRPPPHGLRTKGRRRDDRPGVVLSAAPGEERGGHVPRARRRPWRGRFATGLWRWWRPEASRSRRARLQASFTAFRRAPRGKAPGPGRVDRRRLPRGALRDGGRGGARLHPSSAFVRHGPARTLPDRGYGVRRAGPWGPRGRVRARALAGGSVGRL